MTTTFSPTTSTSSPQGDRSLRLAEAAAGLSNLLESSPPLTEFRPLERAYVRCHGAFAVRARRDDTSNAWLISCTSANDGWCSGEQRCPGSISFNEALAWGERLWHGCAELPYPD